MNHQKSKEKDWEKVINQEENADNNNENEEKEIAGKIEHPSYEKLETQLTLAEQKAQNNWDKYLQVRAELENYKKRAERDINNAYKFNLEKLIVELLPVVDSLEKSLEVQTTAGDKHQQGVELTLKMLLNALAKFGVKQLDPKGEPFNPAYHEAISMQPAADVASNAVTAVLQKGYLLQDRLIRPARVIVAK